MTTPFTSESSQRAAAASATLTRPDFVRIGRRTTLTLFLAQSLGSAGFITASTINAIVGAQLSGRPAWAGVPSGVYLLASALAAWGWGYGMDRLGRRGGITLGLISGVGGAALAGGAVIMQSFGLLMVGLVFMGIAQAALQFGRFVAAEVHPADQRGRAISNVVLGGTVGAIVGPLMVGPVGRWAQQWGWPQLAGPYGTSLVLFGCGALLVWLRLRPEPRDVGRALARLEPERLPGGASDAPRAISTIARQPAVIVAVTAMVMGQVTMVMLMVITSLYMQHQQHSLDAVALVISSHTVGMFAFSIVSGRMADRWGRGLVITIGAATLVLACLLAPVSPAVPPIAFALFLLGLGWNFCFVGGSSLLADQLSPAERARIQGVNDLLIGLVSAFGSVSSGLIFAAVGYGTMSIVGAIAAAIPLGLGSWWLWHQRRSAAPS